MWLSLPWLFNHKTRTKEKEAHQTKDEVSILSRKVDSWNREHEFKQFITVGILVFVKKITLVHLAIGEHGNFMKKIEFKKKRNPETKVISFYLRD